MEMAFSNSAFFDDQDDDDFLQNEDFFYNSPRVSVLDTIPEETVEELDIEQVGAGDLNITNISDVSVSTFTCTNQWLKQSIAYNNNNDERSFLGKRDLEWRTRVFDDLMASTDGVKLRYRSRSLEDINKDANNDKGLSLSVEAPPCFVLFDVAKTSNSTSNSARKQRKCSRNVFKDDLLSSDDEDEYSSSKNVSLTSRYVCQDLTQIDELERDSPRQPRPSNENLSQDSGFCDVGQPEVNLMDTIGEECERKTNEVEDLKMRSTIEAKKSDSNNRKFEFQEIGDIDDDSSWSGGLLQKQWEKSIQSGRAITDDWLTYGPKVVFHPKVIKGWKSLPVLSVPEIQTVVQEPIKQHESSFDDVGSGEIIEGLSKIEEDMEDKSVDLRNVFAECRKRVQEGRDRVAKSVSNLSQVERSVRQQLELQMTSSVKCQSVGYLETDLDTMQSRAVDETNMDQVMGSIKNASKTLSMMTLPRPRNLEEDKTRSMEFLLNEENRKSVQPPENQLREDGQKSLSQHELRVRKSLQNLDVPDWLKKSLHTNGFILKRKNSGNYLGTFPSKTSSPTSNNAKTCLIPSFYWRYLNSGSNTPTSPSKCDDRQPYLGWRSMEKISLKQANFYQTPPERLSSTPGYYALKYGSYNRDNKSDCNGDASQITECIKPRRQRIIWIESSFVGVRNGEYAGCNQPKLKDIW